MLLVSAGSLTLALLASEGTLRLLGYGNLVRYRPSPDVGWEHIPSQRALTRVGRHPIAINSLGLRGPEIPIARPPGTIRILVLGDSSTFGWGVRQEDTYPARLEGLLVTRFPTRRFEVVNGGVNGYSMAQERAYLESRGVGLGPVVVVVSHTWNESWNTPALVPRTDHLETRVRLVNLLRRSAIFQFVRDFRLTELLDRFLDESWESDPPPERLVQHEALLRSVVAIARQHGLRLVFVSLAARNQQDLTPMQRRMADVAAATNTTFVDVVAAFKPRGAGGLFLDPVHPSPAGHAVLAEVLAQALVANLKLAASPESVSRGEGS